MTPIDLAADAEQLAGAGIGLDEARRQIELLRSPPPPPRLDRPCVVGDGIRRIRDAERGELEEAWRTSAETGRFTKFVPASGAATRMFAAPARALEGDAPRRSELEARADRGDSDATELVEILDRLVELPFFPNLAEALGESTDEIRRLARSDDYLRILEAMLSPQGLAFAERPKALVPFHRYGWGSRTALEEHLVEGASYLEDSAGVSRYHFTVARGQRSLFEACLDATPRTEHVSSISLSTQQPRTDTLALEADGSLARHADGSLILRPGGHGALIDNLEALDGDLVYLKNIDNILPESRQGLVTEWQRLLGGLATKLERRVREILRTLREAPTPADLETAATFCADELGWSPAETDGESRRRELIAQLARPLRVCGVVPQRGEPGGGPFWVRSPDGGVSRQIVEAAQVDMGDASQVESWNASTHFNPVMLVAALRRPGGGCYRLAEFVDSRAVFVSDKPHLDRRLRVLERPGLWNGAMAYWNSVFVEVPLATFAPVKSIVDLLRPEHRS